MRFTNNGRVRVTTTHVQLGADEGVKMWHGKNKLWPPDTPPKIKAVTLNPDQMPFEPTGAYVTEAYNRWNFLAAQRILASGKGSAKMSGYALSRMDGYTAYFSEKPDYGYYMFKKGAPGRIDVTPTGISSVSGVVDILGTLRLETNMPIGNGVLTLSSEVYGSRLSSVLEYTVRTGFVVGGTDHETGSVNLIYKGRTNFSQNYGVYLYGCQNVNECMDIQKNYPAPEKFYIVIENTTSRLAKATSAIYNPFWYSSFSAYGVITKVHV